MCGIVGYIGKARRIHFLLDTLKQLEYRGYDSCGVAYTQHKKIAIKKTKGKISQLRAKFKNDAFFTRGIAHTRWATHGIPNHTNAHPHFSCNREFVLVHNGIIENHHVLRTLLQQKGHVFASETDTEVIPHLLEEYSRNGDIAAGLRKTVKMLEGSFSLVFFNKDFSSLFFAKKNSPLILALGRDGFLLASDIPAIVKYSRQVVSLPDYSWGYLDENKYQVLNFKGKKLNTAVEKVTVSSREITKKNYQHFMLKEIFEQPKVLSHLYSLYVHNKKIFFPDLGLKESYLKKLNKIFIYACGTAYHAGFVAKYFLEKHCGIVVEIDVSSEARYRQIRLDENSLVIAISQSGETADTLAAVREAKKKKAKILSVCNVLGSSLTKESDGVLPTYAGPEIGVASTKAYTAQIYVLFLFALYIAKLKRTLSSHANEKFLQEMEKIPQYQKKILEHNHFLRRISRRFSRFGCFLFLGRGIHYPTAMEGALKLKEISYIPAEGYPAGEMKHGPIALIDEYRAVVCVTLKDALYAKMISNIQEIKARRGKVLGIINAADKETKRLMDETIVIPQVENSDLSPLTAVLPLQLFAYYVAKNLGCEIDQPRNLAKSVTVE